MREIKFRRQHFDINGNLIGTTYWGKIDEKGNACERTFSSPSVLSGTYSIIDEQLTGFEDKNGTDIYDGDILRIFDIGKGGEGTSSFIDTVYYDEKKGAWFVGYGWLYDHAKTSIIEGSRYTRNNKTPC